MADLDDFFKKKDRKKANKRQEETVKASDLFKVLDNAAQNGLTEDLDEERKSRQQPELGPVLSEVLKPEEASKWSEPVEEERYYDLSNLKIENLQTTEEDAAEAAAAVEKDQPVKASKIWTVPAAKHAPGTVEVKTGTPGDRKEEDLRAAWTEVPEKKKREKVAAVPAAEAGAGEVKQEEVAEHHGILETVAAGLGSAVGTVVGTVSGLLHLDGKSTTDAAATKESESPAAPAATAAPEKAVYISRGARIAMEEAARAEAAKAALEKAVASRVSAPPPTAAIVGPLSSGAGGVYIPRARILAEEQAAREARLGTASGFRPSNNKKPELDNEEEFPTLGGMGGGKHK